MAVAKKRIHPLSYNEVQKRQLKIDKFAGIEREYSSELEELDKLYVNMLQVLSLFVTNPEERVRWIRSLDESEKKAHQETVIKITAIRENRPKLQKMSLDMLNTFPNLKEDDKIEPASNFVSLYSDQFDMISVTLTNLILDAQSFNEFMGQEESVK